MRILGMMVMMMFFAVGAASAVTVNLTNGSAVQGDIVKRDSKSLQISVDGVAMTYYADEIKDVDGKPFVAEQTKPAQEAAASVPIAKPEVAAKPAPAVPAPAFVAGTIDPDKKARLLTQWLAGLARPFTCLAVVLIALPFGARAGRHNVFVGVASSIFICFGYFILQKISLALGLGGYLSPVLAAWLPNVVCGGTGLALLSRVR